MTIGRVEAFFLVWATWTFLDRVLLPWHPWAEVAVFAIGTAFVVPWSEVLATNVRSAEEMLSSM
jgi:hypothetical protein